MKAYPRYFEILDRKTQDFSKQALAENS